jgi:hypothetical protein
MSVRSDKSLLLHFDSNINSSSSSIYVNTHTDVNVNKNLLDKSFDFSFNNKKTSSNISNIENLSNNIYRAYFFLNITNAV